MSSPISADLDAIEGLAGELGVLGDEPTEDARVCASCASSLGAALEGVHGEAAAGTGRAWALLIGALGERAGGVAATLGAAVSAYRAVDGALADQVASRRPTPR